MSRHETNQSGVRSVAAFNPSAPGFNEDPYPVLESLRKQAPVHYWEEGRGWLLTRYEEAIAVLRDKRFTPDRSEWEFASMAGPSRQPPEIEELHKYGLFALSNQDHVRVRKLVSPAFTPRAIERLRPEIQSIVDEVLAAVEAKGTLDVVHDYAERIPSRVIGSMLKIPKGQEALFQRFTDAVVRSLLPGLLRPEEQERLHGDIREGIALIGETIEARRRNPLEGDILTTLIQTEEQGDKLNKQELLSLVAALIVGGFETTVHLIAFTVFNLLRRPAVLEQVKAEPDLMKNVIEEVLRFDNFGKMGLARYATEDVEIGGVTIRKGQLVLILLNSALRDAAVFSDADVFDVRRNTNASIAFGHGAHYCLGANLARLEVQIAASTLVHRFPEMQLLAPPAFGPHPLIRKMEALEVRLRPGRA